MGIRGLYGMVEPRRYFARPGEISIHVGDPVEFSSETDVLAVTADLEARVRELAHATSPCDS